MLRIIVSQISRRPGRGLAVVAAIVVAAVSFSLLSSTVATSQAQVKGTLSENFRGAYDLLVRPPGSTTPLERRDALVRENFLSDIFGGITVAQWQRVVRMPGVEVAAPVAMVGYAMTRIVVPIYVDDLLSHDKQQIFRLHPMWAADRGLSHYQDADLYIYVTRRHVTTFDNGEAVQTDPISRKRLRVCVDYNQTNSAIVRSAFDRKAQTSLACFTTNPPTPDPYTALQPGRAGVAFLFSFPMLLAAIDPGQEARLVGLDKSVVSGRYLTATDRTDVVTIGDAHEKTQVRQVPVLIANRPTSDDQLGVAVQRLALGNLRAVPGRLVRPGATDWLADLPGRTVLTATVSDAQAYPKLLSQITGKKQAPTLSQYWSAQPVRYAAAGDALRPTVRTNPVNTWVERANGFLAPAAAEDVAFRRLQVHVGSNHIGLAGSPLLHAVGVIDPKGIRGFSHLSAVPLTTYNPPTAEPGDARTRVLLKGRPLLPSANIGGYLQQPPLLLTTLASLPELADPSIFEVIDAKDRVHPDPASKAPISVIRVRVAGVTGPDKASQERVRLVAERISRETGLRVDVTIGSSPTPKLIDLPAGKFGRPALTLKEGWVAKGVAVTLLRAIDRKSIVLFLLVLLTCLLFLVNATVASVRARHIELGVLASLGWPRRRIFALLETELAMTGLAAGLLGTGLATALVTSFDLRVPWLQIALITPVSTVLAALAGLGPVWKACGARPMEAIRPAVRPPRRAVKIDSVNSLALVGVVRWPGRTALAATSLFVGVASFGLLIAVQLGFRGQAVGTLLGDTVAVQVRGVDYVAAALTLALGAVAVADVAYLNISERAGEIGTLRANGWADRHVRRLFATEAMITAVIGVLAAVATIAALVQLALPIPAGATALAAGLAAAAGVISAAIALVLPIGRLNQLAPAAAVADR